jgi:hypothetical protein
VKAAISNFNPKILSLQETKLEEISLFKAMTFLPPSLRSFHFIPSIGASGGILTAWDDREIECTHMIYNTYSITTSFASRLFDLSFSITNVYGPCTAVERPIFFDELKNMGPSVSSPWTIFGDFNAMLDPDDRSNASFNSTDATLFSATINTLLLQEIPLVNHRFTWSNHQLSPILALLDRAFVNLDWSIAFLDSTLTATSKNTLDHVPLILSASTSVPKLAVFRFSNLLLHSNNFLTMVGRVWNSLGSHSLPSTGSIGRRLKRVRAVAKTLQKNQRSPSTLATNCKIVIAMLDLLEESRSLSKLESALRVGVLLVLHRHNALRATY